MRSCDAAGRSAQAQPVAPRHALALSNVDAAHLFKNDRTAQSRFGSGIPARRDVICNELFTDRPYDRPGEARRAGDGKNGDEPNFEVKFIAFGAARMNFRVRVG